jgi:hypothetical protein
VLRVKVAVPGGYWSWTVVSPGGIDGIAVEVDAVGVGVEDHVAGDGHVGVALLEPEPDVGVLDP